MKKYIFILSFSASVNAIAKVAFFFVSIKELILSCKFEVILVYFWDSNSFSFVKIQLLPAKIITIQIKIRRTRFLIRICIFIFQDILFFSFYIMAYTKLKYYFYFKIFVYFIYNFL
jgi:hypothetical protein